MADTTKAPVEQKVVASTGAAYVAAFFLTAFINGAQSEDHALLLGALPEWVEVVLLPLLPAVATFLSGYMARHTPRPDLGEPNQV